MEPVYLNDLKDTCKFLSFLLTTYLSVAHMDYLRLQLGCYFLTIPAIVVLLILFIRSRVSENYSESVFPESSPSLTRLSQYRIRISPIHNVSTLNLLASVVRPVAENPIHLPLVGLFHAFSHRGYIEQSS